MEGLREIARQIVSLKYQKAKRYEPYEKQLAFHNAGTDHRERLFLAGNQLGKTYCGGYETYCHLTGNYPDWWQGKRFNKPIRCWAAGVSNKATRERVQVMLLGDENDWGTGMIPPGLIVGKPVMNRAISGLVDYVNIRHKDGDTSRLVFKSYEMKLATWASDEMDFIWLDEEPPEDIHTECLARVTNTKGHIIITFTPLLGMSEVVRKFYPNPDTRQRWWVMMDIFEAKHIPDEERQDIIDKYPEHEKEARTKGIPMLGSGRVFVHTEESIAETPFEIPPHWARANAIDLGYGDHPTAVVFGAHDRDADVVHIYDCYRNRDIRLALHADAIKMRPNWIPCAYPHDAGKGDPGSGDTYANMYRKKGVRMMGQHATYREGGYTVEPGILMMNERFATGRLKVFSNLSLWFEEYRTYHRKDGLIVAEHDDLMSASRLLIMMLRQFREEPIKTRQNQTMAYDVLDPYASRH
jgi:phage terminase large subunit-like protein